jgi:GH35 family endo-1,4-beta-xylanase
MDTLEEIATTEKMPWYQLNKLEFLKNKRKDYNDYYKYYYKCRTIILKYPGVIPDDVLNHPIIKNADYKHKYLLMKQTVDEYILTKIENDIQEVPDSTRRVYKQLNN